MLVSMHRGESVLPSSWRLRFDPVAFAALPGCPFKTYTLNRTEQQRLYSVKERAGGQRTDRLVPVLTVVISH